MLCSNAALRNSWFAVAASGDVVDAPVGVQVLGTPVVLYRSGDGEVVAVPDRCPHREAPLSGGTVVDGCLVCPYHGWTFGAGGSCVRVPSAPAEVPVPPRAHLRRYPSQERYGLIWICVGEPVGSLPIVAEDIDPSFRRLNTPVEVWNTSVARMTDNFLDVSHFPYVHVGTFGRAQDTETPKFDVVDLGDGWTGYQYEVQANNDGGGAAASGQTNAVVHRSMSTGFHLPFDVRSTIRYENGLDHVLLLISTPIDEVTSYFTFVIWRNDDFSVPADDIIAFDRAIGAEDKAMLEQIGGPMPLDPTALVSTAADRCGIEWRRRLIALTGEVPSSDGAV
jgi:phenylpropionate dioxygenase-like ring-hydroxylating dioxygenase large terminal subunit